jgi:hypothetical protein
MGGNCQALEEELIFTNPPHDDIKDALASVIDFAQGKAPSNMFAIKKENNPNALNYHGRFGGVL